MRVIVPMFKKSFRKRYQIISDLEVRMEAVEGTAVDQETKGLLPSLVNVFI